MTIQRANGTIGLSLETTFREDQPFATWLSGDRLLLQDGPMVIVVTAKGPGRIAGYTAALARFASILDELLSELPLLRRPTGQAAPETPVGRRMHAATAVHGDRFVTPMAAVCGSVADELLAAMTAAAPLSRAKVVNGSDIALHLAPGETHYPQLPGLDVPGDTRLYLHGGDGIGGIATSRRGQRGLSLGIADEVTVLAANAAAADAASTLIASAVDLPGHSAITRTPAATLDPESDLGDRPVVTTVARLRSVDIARALQTGLQAASQMIDRGLIRAASLHLQGTGQTVGETGVGRGVLSPL